MKTLKLIHSRYLPKQLRSKATILMKISCKSRNENFLIRKKLIEKKIFKVQFQVCLFRKRNLLIINLSRETTQSIEGDAIND